VNVIDRVLEIADELRERNRELSDMVAAWESGDDVSMAENDPGLQFAKEQEIQSLLDSLRTILKDESNERT
jgi:hypothetical protein